MHVRRRPASGSQGSCTHTPLWGPHKPCACAGAAQYMFSSASSFNQPVEAWDVGQVTNMQVCRCPASGSQGSCTHAPLWGPHKPCACAGAAQNMFQSASSFNQSVDAWNVGQVTDMQVCCRPASGSQGSCTHTPLWGPHKPCACAGAAQYMFSSASSFNQPVEAWDVGQVTTMQVRRRPASWSQGSCTRTAAQRSGHKPCACAGAAQSMFN